MCRRLTCQVRCANRPSPLMGACNPFDFVVNNSKEGRWSSLTLNTLCIIIDGNGIKMHLTMYLHLLRDALS